MLVISIKENCVFCEAENGFINGVAMNFRNITQTRQLPHHPARPITPAVI
jgi:hypothetical protein